MQAPEEFWQQWREVYDFVRMVKENPEWIQQLQPKPKKVLYKESPEQRWKRINRETVKKLFPHANLP